MMYELNEQQRTQVFTVLWHWKHVLFKEHDMPITDELLDIFNKPYYEPKVSDDECYYEHFDND